MSLGPKKSTRFGINITWAGGCDDASGGAGGWGGSEVKLIA